MSLLSKKRAFLKQISRGLFLVRSLSVACPQPVRNLSATCPDVFLKKCSTSVRSLSAAWPQPVRSLSARKCKKRTTPFGGMARPYYSLPTPLFPPLFHSFSSLFHLSYLSRIQLIKFSQEYSK